MQVRFPVDTLKNPDWQFMEDYIRERDRGNRTLLRIPNEAHRRF